MAGNAQPFAAPVERSEPPGEGKKTADYQEERGRILAWLEGFGDPLTLYRGVRVGSPDQVNTRQLGIFWTPVKRLAHSPYGASKHGIEVVVEAKAKRRDVDVDGTVTTMRRHPSEMEIRLKIGSTVQVVRLHLPNRKVIPLGRPGKTATLEHYILKCSSCDSVIERCKCKGPHEVRYAVCAGCEKTAVKTKPSYPYPTDEHAATNENLWKRVLEVASGRLREFTQGDRTIHAPNDGRGFRKMPANPNGIAWAVKQYNGFGGAWRNQKEEKVAAQSPLLRVLAAGGVAVSEGGEFDALARAGFIQLSGEQGTRRYWDITEQGRRVVQAGLKEDLLHKVRELKDLGRARQDAPALTDEDKRTMREVAVWFRKHFRVDSVKTPKGHKRLKDEAMAFLNSLEQLSVPGGWTSPAALNLDAGPWGRTLEKELDTLVEFFTGEGDAARGKKEEVVELRLTHATYFNRGHVSEVHFRKYAEKIDGLLGRIKGWRRKALKGTLKVVLQNASMKVQGKYKTALDEMWIKATPAVMKRGEGSYGSPDYILLHELGHRYERFNRLSMNFDTEQWWTTEYSRTVPLSGSSESFAELFALGHYGIKGNWDPAILERFEGVMTGKNEETE